MEPIPTAKNATWSWNLQELPTVAMNGENQPLVEVQEFRRITNPFRGIYGIHKTERSQHVKLVGLD
jgi:hypothetical protein